MRLTRILRSRLTARLGRPGDDRGLTLIELLVTISILGVIAVPLSAALMTYFQHTDDTTERLSISHDAQISAAYFAQDVQSMGTHDWNTGGFPLRQSMWLDVAPTAGPNACGAASLPNAIIRMAWDDPTAASGGNVWRVSYYLQPVSGGLNELHRIVCTTSTTPTSDLLMAHNVDTVDVSSCPTPSVCTGSTPPQTVTLVLHLKSSHNTVNGPLTVTLTGQRRQT